MSVQSTTNYSNKALILSGEGYNKEDGTIKQDAGRSAVLAQFTVMGKKRYSVPTTGTADAGNTGDGTVTAVAALSPGNKLIIGGYVLTCTAAVANGGTFKLEDPAGNLIADNLIMTAGAGAATVFNAGGLTFTITDGATDFAVDDFFTITITADGDYWPLNDVGVVGESQVAGIYLGDELTAAKIVAGDIPNSPVLIGGKCTIDKNLVVLENSLTLSSVLPSGKSVREELEDLGIFPESTLDIDSYQS